MESRYKELFFKILRNLAVMQVLDVPHCFRTNDLLEHVSRHSTLIWRMRQESVAKAHLTDSVLWMRLRERKARKCLPSTGPFVLFAKRGEEFLGPGH